MNMDRGRSIIRRILDVWDDEPFLLFDEEKIKCIYGRYMGRFSPVGAPRFFNYFIDYIRYRIEESVDYRLARALELMLRRQLLKLFTVPTHDYHMYACIYAKRIFKYYRETATQLIEKYRRILLTLIDYYNESVFWLDRRKRNVLGLEPISRETVLWYVHEYGKYITAVGEIIEIALAVAKSGCVRREKEKLMYLMTRVYDDLCTDLKYNPANIQIEKVFRNCLDALERHSIKYPRRYSEKEIPLEITAVG